MTTEARTLTVSGVPFAVVRKAIKNLHLGAYPPDGHVRVAAPLTVSDAAVRVAVVGRLQWIRRRQAIFAGQAREPRREMLSGESHYFFGRRYRLHVEEASGPARVLLRAGPTLVVRVDPERDASYRKGLLHAWYREQLTELVTELVRKWKVRLRVKPAAWGPRRMKTKWGSCNPKNRRLLFNLELAKKPHQCIEYVVVHELVHLLVRRHDEKFRRLLDKHLPQWEGPRNFLNASPLADESGARRC